MAGPVKAEKNIEEIMSSLKGIAYENWIRKWIRYVNELLRIYGVEDPQVPLGIYDPTDPEEIKKLLEEHCKDLTESECYQKIEEIIRSYGYTKEKEITKQELIDQLSRWEKEEEKVYKALEKFGLPVELPPDIAEQLLEIYKNPTLNHESVYSLVKRELLNLGWDEKDADEIARKSAEAIDRITKKVPKARPTTVAHWTEILRYATVTSRKRLKRRETKARNLLDMYLEEITKKEQTTRYIYKVSQLPSFGFKVVRARKTRSPEESLEAIRANFYRLEPAIVSAPAKVIVYTDRDFYVDVREITPKRGAPYFVIRGSEEPILVVKEEGNTVYYQIVKPAKRVMR